MMFAHHIAVLIAATSRVYPPHQQPRKETVNLQDLIGKTEQEATDAIKAAGGTPRVTQREGVRYMCTRDYRTDRVNLVIWQGKVSKADIG